MFLSRVQIDKSNRRKIKVLSHVGAFHHWVEESFPNEIEEEVRSRKLWRIDTLSNIDYLLIVSPTAPNIDNLEKYGVPGSGQIIDYEPYLNSLKEGMTGRFRVTLNPVVSVMQDPNSKRGRVMPHVTVDQQREFLLNRSEKNGFHLDSDEFYIVNRAFVPFKKAGQKNIQLSKVDYEGMLTIINLNKFRNILEKGFGKKKAYGFGLLTFIPNEV